MSADTPAPITATTTLATTTNPTQPLITQFKPPSECNGRFRVAKTSTFTTTSRKGMTGYFPYTLFFSDLSKDKTCQPPDFIKTTAIETRYLTFSPAVCPSGWTAYGMHVHTWADPALHTMSEATCCSSGFTIATAGNPFFPTQGSYRAPICESVRAVATAPLAARDRFYHHAWVVDWAAADTPLLNPRPPELQTNCSYPLEISSWVPGQAVNPQAIKGGCAAGSSPLAGPGGGSSGSSGVSLTSVAIAVPLVVAFLVIGCISWCCCGCCQRTGYHHTTNNYWWNTDQPPESVLMGEYGGGYEGGYEGGYDGVGGYDGGGGDSGGGRGGGSD